jgi:hypothetical protein
VWRDSEEMRRLRADGKSQPYIVAGATEKGAARPHLTFGLRGTKSSTTSLTSHDRPGYLIRVRDYDLQRMCAVRNGCASTCSRNSAMVLGAHLAYFERLFVAAVARLNRARCAF